MLRQVMYSTYSSTNSHKTGCFHVVLILLPYILTYIVISYISAVYVATYTHLGINSWIYVVKTLPKAKSSLLVKTSYCMV